MSSLVTEDIFCPSWLKMEPTSESVTSESTLQEISLNKITENAGNNCKEKRSNKRNLQLDTLNPRTESLLSRNASLNKRVDSPVKSTFVRLLVDGDPTSQPIRNMSPFHRTVIELLETEQEYHKIISFSTSIYRSLLTNCKEYRNLLTKDETEMLFNNLNGLIEDSAIFMAQISQELLAISCFKDTNNQKFKKTEGYDIYNLVLNCDLRNLDLGSILNHYFKSNYKIHILDYFLKHDMQIKILNQKKQYGGVSFNEWLTEAAFLANSKTKILNFETILLSPIQRILKYPSLIKGIINSSAHICSNILLHELTTSLLKINQTIEKANRLQRLQEIPFDTDLYYYRDQESGDGEDSILSQLTDHNGNGIITITDNKQKGSEKIPQVEEKFDIGIPQFSKTEYATLLKAFRSRYQNLEKMRLCFLESFKSMELIIDRHQHFASLWKDLLQLDDPCSDDEGTHFHSIYTSYIDKIGKQRDETSLLICEIREKIVQPLNLVLKYCDGFIMNISDHRKYRSCYVKFMKETNRSAQQQNKLIKRINSVKRSDNFLTNHHDRNATQAQLYIKIENQLKDNLPPMFGLLDEFVDKVTSTYNKLILRWLNMLIGDRAMKEYDERHRDNEDSKKIEKRREEKYSDIIQYYINCVQMNKTALRNSLLQQEKSGLPGAYYLQFYANT